MMTHSYLKILGRLLENSPLGDLTLEEFLLVSPIFKISLELIQIFDIEEWKKEELFLVKNLLYCFNKGLYLYVFDYKETLFISEILSKAGMRESKSYSEVQKILN